MVNLWKHELFSDFIFELLMITYSTQYFLVEDKTHESGYI